MVQWFGAPALEGSLGTVVFVLSIFLPGLAQIIAGVVAKPNDTDSIIVGIVMIIANILLWLLLPIVGAIVFTVLTVVSFGILSFIWVAYPLCYLGFLLIYPWSIYWGYNCYKNSEGGATPQPTTNTTQQPQQPMEQQPQQQQPMEQQPQQQQPMEQAPMQQAPMEQQPMEQAPVMEQQ
eukprot:gene2347-2815_t